MLFFQLNHFCLAAGGQNAHLTKMDYKFIHVHSNLRKRPLLLNDHLL